MKDTLDQIKINHRATVALDALSTDKKDGVLQAVNDLAISGLYLD
ncbi:hypothetical protein [Argonema galeatum]|nr:hypothetical protein [Argonema galeatum]